MSNDNKITINTDKQKQKLLQIIKNKYQDNGGYIENETLFIGDQSTSLSPILNIFEHILKSKVFTRLPPLFDKTENFPISDMYVELAVSESLEIANPVRLTRDASLADQFETRHKLNRAKHVSLEECVNNQQHNNIIILGDPGSGKTSLLKYLCLQIAKDTNKRWLLPIFISLRQYWLEKEKYPSLTLIHYAAATLVAQNTATNLSPNFSILLREENEDGANVHHKKNIKELEGVLSHISSTDHKHVLFVLDGLDEIASNEEASTIVSEDIRQLGHGFSWVVSSRFTGFYSELEDDIRYEIVSLHNTAIQELVTNWFKHTQQPNSEEKTEFILNQIWKNSRLLEMARNPFLLTLLCYVQNFNETKLLPLQRNDIYREIIDLIRRQLQNKEPQNCKLLGKTEINYLAKFCYFLYTEAENAPLQLFDKDEWNECAYPGSPPDLDLHFLSSRLLHSWKTEGDYHFVHLTFQEYFIALHLSTLEFNDVLTHIYNPQWRMVYRFLAGAYGKQQNKKRVTNLIQYLLDPVDKMGVLYIEVAMLLLEAEIEDSSTILNYDIREKLWETWCNDKSYLKNGAADALAQLSPDYIIKKHLQVILNENEKEKNQLLRKSIALLTYIHTDEADELLLNLFQEPSHPLYSEVIKALAQKNSSAVSDEVISIYLSDKDKWFESFCLFAKVSKNKALIPHLKPYLSKKPKDLNHYAKLFEALASINSNEITKDLFSFISNYSTEELSKELINCILSLETQIVSKWVEKILSGSMPDLIKDKITICACEHNKLPIDDFIALLQQDNTNSQKQYIEAIRIQGRNGLTPDKKIIQLLVKIMLSNSDNNEIAFEALLDVNPQNITHGKISQQIKQQYRKFINSKDQYRASSAITILAQSSDIQSFETILQLALSENSDLSIKIEAIRALAYYHQFESRLVIDALHKIYDKEKDEVNRYFAGDALITLAKINIREISEYINDPRNNDNLATLCATENILLFDNYYIDRYGIKHNWCEKKSVPKINPSLPAYEQQDELRALCLYLLKEGFAKKSGRLDTSTPPLFYKNSPVNELFKSITKNPGDKFLKGDNLRPEKAQLLMDWVMKKFSKLL